ncbi:hypothetical protein ACHHYP_12882 [Achlya hypogyna]|uniref:Armadillo repeat-containing protein n=1 Tax=Achlya hypogyna TaxID=1202772 RepID=A0A1V9ZG87_ACHHY|nr:hypothetical protein ACHHYP_12882 [Achlya hypogyna]
MDEYIARGAISSVLKQARASLKHPSRPFTPKTGSRPLFYGDDYRPSSRPSSTFSKDVTEFEKPAPKKRHSRRRDNQEVEAVTSPIATARDERPQSSQTDYGCSAEKEAVSDEEQAAKAASDDDDCSNPVISTTEALRDRLCELQAHLESFRLVDDDDQDLAAVLAIAKATAQIQHDAHLLNSAAPLDALAEANAACLAQLFECIEGASGRAVIELTRAALTLYGCRLGPLGPFEDAVVRAAKLLFLQSKEPGNDDHFCHVAIVETLLGVMADATATGRRALPPMQLLIYVAGTLKNVSSASRMVTLLATNGAISILKATLELQLAHAGGRGGENPVAQLLVQVTAILRNLAVNKACHKQFWQWHVTAALCALLPLYPSHLELMLNVSRVLSKLTLHEAGRTQLNKAPETLGHLVQLLDRSSAAAAPHRFQAALLVRLCFVLGNLTASNDKNRKLLAVQLRAVPVLVRILRQYGALYAQQAPKPPADDSDDDDDDDNESEDVLVKLVRLLANLSINATAGPLAAAAPGIDALLELLAHASACGHEELKLNVVSCVTNLSYYATPDNVVAAHRLALADLLAAGLADPNEEMVVEAARALGNLARFPDVLARLAAAGGLAEVVALLQHPSRPVAAAACGVLVNAALDPPSRVALLHLETRDTLVGVFRASGLADVACSTLVCKVLFNLGLQDAKGDKYRDRPAGRLLLGALEELVDGAEPDEALAEFQGVAKALMRSLLAS